MGGRLTMGGTHTPTGSDIRGAKKGWSDSKSLEQIWRLLRNITSGDESLLSVRYGSAGITITPKTKRQKKQKRATAAAAGYNGPYNGSASGAEVTISRIEEPLINEETHTVLGVTGDRLDITITASTTVWLVFFLETAVVLAEANAWIATSPPVNYMGDPLIQSERLHGAKPIYSIAIGYATLSGGEVTWEQWHTGGIRIYPVRSGLRYASSVQRLYLTYPAHPVKEIYLDIPVSTPAKYITIQSGAMVLETIPTGDYTIGKISTDGAGVLTGLNDYSKLAGNFDGIPLP